MVILPLIEQNLLKLKFSSENFVNCYRILDISFVEDSIFSTEFATEPIFDFEYEIFCSILRKKIQHFHFKSFFR